MHAAGTATCFAECRACVCLLACCRLLLTVWGAACRLELSGSTLLHWTSLLPLCARLEVLRIDLPQLDDHTEHLLCSHLW